MGNSALNSLLHHSADWRSTTQLHARSTAGRIPLWDVWKRMAADNHYERPSRAKESEGRSNEGADLFSIRFNTSEGYKESKTTFLQEKPFYKKWKLNHIFLFTFLFALPRCLMQCHDTGCTHTQARFALQIWAEMLLVAKKYTGTSPTFSTGLKKPCEQEPRSLPSVSDLSTSHLAFRCCVWNDPPELLCHHHPIENC